MELKGEQVKQLHQALLSAFPDSSSLKIMVRIGLDESLEQIVGGGNLSTMVFDLIEWATSRGRLEELVEKAYEANPGNPKLHLFAEQFLRLPVRTSPSTTIEAPSGSTVNRLELIRKLNSLTNTDMDVLISAVPEATKYDVPTLPTPTRVAKLIGYAESGTGRGLQEIYQTAHILFPSLFPM